MKTYVVRFLTKLLVWLGHEVKPTYVSASQISSNSTTHPTRDELLNHVKNLINAFERLGPRTPTMIEVEMARAYIGQRKNEQRAE